MSKRTILTCAGLLALTTAGQVLAWNGCDNRRVLEERLDLSDAQSLRIVAVAGELEIRGEPGLSEARIKATICASDEDHAQASRLELETGRQAAITAVLPDHDWSSWGRNKYLYMDLEIVVPEELALNVLDSSGDLSVDGAGAVQLKDSSGDIDVRDTASVEVQDSSGDIDLDNIRGDVVVASDSSGDIYGEAVAGSVLVERDSSGDIRFRGVKGDFLVERDSSGDIIARDIDGDFRVLRDGSGGISHDDVAGEVDIPEDKR